jgi:hypothetical protein
MFKCTQSGGQYDETHASGQNLVNPILFTFPSPSPHRVTLKLLLTIIYLCLQIFSIYCFKTSALFSFFQTQPH